MNSLSILLTLSATVSTVFGGCFSGSSVPSNRPRLGIEINKHVSWAGANEKIFVNVYAANKWNGWRKIDNTACDDFVRGETDYFDDFDSVTAEWEGLAFYTCGNDGILVETIKYWDGDETKNCYLFENQIFGPFAQKCLYNDNSVASDTSPNSVYSDFYLDGDAKDADCRGTVFALDGYYGRVWDGVAPGKPNCGASEYGYLTPVAHYLKNGQPLSAFEETLFKWLIGIVAVVVFLFAVNSCLMYSVVAKKNNKFDYGKVSYETDEELVQ